MTQKQYCKKLLQNSQKLALQWKWKNKRIYTSTLLALELVVDNPKLFYEFSNTPRRAF